MFLERQDERKQANNNHSINKKRLVVNGSLCQSSPCPEVVTSSIPTTLWKMEEEKNNDSGDTNKIIKERESYLLNIHSKISFRDIRYNVVFFIRTSTIT